MYSVDYLGAENAGMRAVLMDVSGAYKEKPATRVESLEELRRVLADGKFKLQGVPADME
jgi:FMN phosphatase YigB (HAD superfamily)